MDKNHERQFFLATTKNSFRRIKILPKYFLPYFFHLIFCLPQFLPTVILSIKMPFAIISVYPVLQCRWGHFIGNPSAPDKPCLQPLLGGQPLPPSPPRLWRSSKGARPLRAHPCLPSHKGLCWPLNSGWARPEDSGLSPWPRPQYRLNVPGHCFPTLPRSQEWLVLPHQF